MKKTEKAPVPRLGLPEADAEKFQLALQHYGHESTAEFMRQCALCLIRHHQADEKLVLPLSFKTSRSL
jgi:hypothetical protein